MELSVNYKKLMDVRTELNLTQEDVAKHINVRRFTYSKKERGLLSINLREAYLIANLFGMSMEELFFGN